MRNCHTVFILLICLIKDKFETIGINYNIFLIFIDRVNLVLCKFFNISNDFNIIFYSYYYHIEISV